MLGQVAILVLQDQREQLERLELLVQLGMLALPVCLVVRQILELRVQRVVLVMLAQLELLAHLAPRQVLELLARRVMSVQQGQPARLVARQIQEPRVK